MKALPATRGYNAIVFLVPSVTGGSNQIDLMPAMRIFYSHGGRGNEGRVQVDGLNIGAAFNGGGVSGYVVGHVQRAGAVVHALGRAGRSRDWRHAAQRRAQDRRQHLRRLVLRQHGRRVVAGQQPRRPAEGIRHQRAGGAEQELGRQRIARRADQAGSRSGSSARCGTSGRSRRFRAGTPTRTRATPRSGPTSRIST